MTVQDRVIGPTAPNDALLEWLRLHEWRRVSRGRLGELWSPPGGESRVAIPEGLTRESWEWSGIVERIANASRLSVSLLARQIDGWDTDEVEFSADEPDSYSVSLEAGEALFRGAYTMMRAAGTSSRGTRAHIGGNWSAVGDRLVESARFRHTRPGSYTVPVEVRLERFDRIEPPSLTDDERTPREPGQRRLTRTLAQAVAAVASNVVEPAREPRQAEVGLMIDAGVTREMVTSMSRILQVESIRGLSTTVRWAGAVPAPASVPEVVRVPREANELLKRTAALLQRERPPRVENVSGPIVRLHDEGTDWAMASVQTIRRGRESTVDIFLSTRLLADQAHDWFKAHETIIATGAIRSAPGKPLTMDRPEQVQLLSETFINLRQ